MLADTLDAMTTDRPYRKALPFERVVDEVRKYSGSQFDPDLADLLIKSQTIRRLVASASLSGVQAPAPPTLDRAASIRAERAAV